MVNNINSCDVHLYDQINENDWTSVLRYGNYFKEKVSGSLTLNKNSGDEFLDEDILQFLKINFKNSENYDEVVLFLNEYSNLLDIIYLIPDLFNKEFPNDFLEIKILSRFEEEKKLLILVHTAIDGFKACKKIEKIEDTLYNDFGNTFVNLLFSAEFLK